MGIHIRVLCAIIYFKNGWRRKWETNLYISWENVSFIKQTTTVYEFVRICLSLGLVKIGLFMNGRVTSLRTSEQQQFKPRSNDRLNYT